MQSMPISYITGVSIAFAKKLHYRGVNGYEFYWFTTEYNTFNPDSFNIEHFAGSRRRLVYLIY